MGIVTMSDSALFHPDFSVLCNSDSQNWFVSCPSTENLFGSDAVASCQRSIPVDIE